MKSLKNILVLLCSLLLFSASCKKEKSKNPIDDLPPATQTGANTFGCLVNGEAFLPKNKGIGGQALSRQYVFDKGKYNLILRASDRTLETTVPSVGIQIDSILFDNERNWVLNNEYTRMGEYFIIGGNIYFNNYKTNSTNTGKLIVTYWDNTKGIISGTFSFDAVNAKGEKVEIREGRFDVKL